MEGIDRVDFDVIGVFVFDVVVGDDKGYVVEGLLRCLVVGLD